MSYGIEIINKHGITILDNRPIPTMRVVEKTEYPSGVSMSALSADPSLSVFVRATEPGAIVYSEFGPTITAGYGVFSIEHLLRTDFGTLTCVKISNADSYVLPLVSEGGNSGSYGLAIFDTQANPSLVFSDKYPNVAYSLSAVSATGLLSTTPLSLSLPGRRKYLNIEALVVPEDSPQLSTYTKPSLLFVDTADQCSITVTKPINPGMYAIYGGSVATYGTIGPSGTRRYFMVIEA